MRDIIWYAHEGIKTFKNEKALRQEWLTTIQYKNDRKKLFLVDSRKQDKYVFQLKKEVLLIFQQLFTVNTMKQKRQNYVLIIMNYLPK